jgi:hypothetical protein
MAVGRAGIHFLDQARVEGDDPLAAYGPNAALHLKRQTGFATCPDILVNGAYDPVTGELSSFEDQVGHHGGLGGAQSHAFVFHPTALPTDGRPVVGATGVYRLLRSWRDGVAGAPPPCPGLADCASPTPSP